MTPGRRLAYGMLSLAFSACCLLTSTSCGYRVAGRGDRLPPGIQTIAVPIFTNSSHEYRIEQRVSAAVTRELIRRTRYQVTTETAGADAVLRGEIKDVRSGAIAFDRETGRATTLQIQVTAQVSFVDLHTQKTVFSKPNYIFREEYQVSQNPATIFEEQNPALDRLARDMARTLITDILENF